MNSLSDLNQWANQTIEVTDNRFAKVVYYNDSFTNCILDIDNDAVDTGTTVSIPLVQGNEVVEVINYQTANLTLTYEVDTDFMSILTWDTTNADEIGNSVVEAGNVQYSTAGLGNNSISLDGTSGLVVADPLLVTDNNDVTYECRAYFNSLSDTVYIFDARSEYASSEIVLLYNHSSKLSLYFNGYIIDYNWTPSLNTWYHFAVVRDSNTMKLYVDGIIVGSATTSSYSNSGQVSIGMRYSQNEGIDGYIDEFRLSDVARYDANFTPSTVEFEVDNNTLSLLHMKEFTGPSIKLSGTTYTITNINSKADWDAVTRPTWVLDETYNTYDVFVITSKATYYNEELEEQIQDKWYTFDPDYYYDALLESSFNIAARGYRIVQSAATLAAETTLYAEPRYAVLESEFGLSCEGEYVNGIMNTTGLTYKSNSASTAISNVYISSPSALLGDYVCIIVVNSGSYITTNASLPLDDNVLQYTGSIHEINSFLESIILYPEYNISTDISVSLSIKQNDSYILSKSFNIVNNGTGLIESISHVFHYDDSFTFSNEEFLYGKMDILVVGGGGGSTEYAGGGAGSVVEELNCSISSQSTNVIVGDCGDWYTRDHTDPVPPGTCVSGSGTNGESSSAFGFIADGGGYARAQFCSHDPDGTGGTGDEYVTGYNDGGTCPSSVTYSSHGGGSYSFNTDGEPAGGLGSAGGGGGGGAGGYGETPFDSGIVHGGDGIMSSILGYYVSPGGAGNGDNGGAPGLGGSLSTPAYGQGGSDQSDGGKGIVVIVVNPK